MDVGEHSCKRANTRFAPYDSGGIICPVGANLVFAPLSVFAHPFLPK